MSYRSNWGRTHHPITGPVVCPMCHKPVVRFDVTQPEKPGTTCNPINSPDCWIKKPIHAKGGFG